MSQPVTLKLARTRTADHARLIVEYRNEVLVDLEDDDMAPLMAAMLLSLGYQALQLDTHTDVRLFTEREVRAVVANQPGAIFQCGDSQNGVVTVWERYSVALDEYRLNLKVDGKQVGMSVDGGFGLSTFEELLLELDYEVVVRELCTSLASTTTSNDVQGNVMDTGIKDKNGKPIQVGDTLVSDYGYRVTVQKDESGFTGRLVTSPSDSCANIPYSLGDGSHYAVA